MKAKYLFIYFLMSNSLFACDAKQHAEVTQIFTNSQDSTPQNYKMKIKIGSKTFTATLYDNETAKVFKGMLPLTLKMDDLNSNEKKYDFPKSLPGKSLNPGTINKGDLMIWGGNTLVLFYKTFSTLYNYAKLGHIDAPSGLAAELGEGSITITYELAN